MLYNTGLFIACAGAAVAAQTAAVVGGLKIQHIQGVQDKDKNPDPITNLQDVALVYSKVAAMDAAIIAPIIGGQDIWRRFRERI